MSPRDAVGEISPELGAIRQVRRRPKLSWSMRIGAGVLIFYVAVALISLVWTPYDPLTPGIGAWPRTARTTRSTVAPCSATTFSNGGFITGGYHSGCVVGGIAISSWSR